MYQHTVPVGVLLSVFDSTDKLKRARVASAGGSHGRVPSAVPASLRAFKRDRRTRRRNGKQINVVHDVERTGPRASDARTSLEILRVTGPRARPRAMPGTHVRTKAVTTLLSRHDIKESEMCLNYAYV